MADDIVLGEEELIAKFRALSTAVQGKTLVTVVQAGGTVVVAHAKDNIRKQGLMRTRNMSRSIHQEVVESMPEKATVEVGTNVVYGPIHEFGGTIQARESKYLAIPVGTRRGSPLKHNDLNVRKTAGGNLVMVDESGIVQYVLKTSVEIPARPWLRPAADENHNEIANAMAEGFAQAIETEANKS